MIFNSFNLCWQGGPKGIAFIWDPLTIADIIISSSSAGGRGGVHTMNWWFLVVPLDYDYNRWAGKRDADWNASASERERSSGTFQRLLVLVSKTELATIACNRDSDTDLTCRSEILGLSWVVPWFVLIKEKWEENTNQTEQNIDNLSVF